MRFVNLPSSCVVACRVLHTAAPNYPIETGTREQFAKIAPLQRSVQVLFAMAPEYESKSEAVRDRLYRRTLARIILKCPRNVLRYIMEEQNLHCTVAVQESPSNR
jgi:hypothetical protein